VVDFPRSEAEISSVWLSHVLGRPVSVQGSERIGVDEGFTGGGLIRIILEDCSMVVKLSPQDVNLRTVFAAANAREVTFYQLSVGRGLPVPACYFGAFDAENGASILLIEDIDTQRSVSFLTGCNVAEIREVTQVLAQVHSAFWDTEVAKGLPTLALLEEFDFARMWAGYSAKVAKLLPDVVLPERFVALGDWLAGETREIFMRMMVGPQTVVHRDAQVDNVLFGEGAVLLDWQFMGRGLGAHDLAFFMISSVVPEVRRGIEDAVIAQYHGALGDNAYTLDQCRMDYLFGAIWRLFITVMATTQLDNASGHKRDWRRADLVRLIAFFEDHEIGSECF